MFFGKPESYEWYAKRCLLYIRVSTEEQVRHGYSLDAQLEELQGYAKQFCMNVVGVYTDDGVSARKEVHKRKGLTALLESVERGETDYILFIKLDRWFRSVREYYKTQDILDRHNVGWKAILEDYDTSTTNGRLNLNIRLSVAQDESDRTSDRIKFVNDNRVKHGGAITGSYPMGLYSENGAVKVDEKKADIVRGIFTYYEDSGSVRNCIDYAASYGVRLGYNTLKRILSNPLYIGRYRDNESYCPVVVPPDQFHNVQRLMESRSHTREQTYVYVFRGMIVCPRCGRKMNGWPQKDYKFDRIYLRYRCNRRWLDKDCTHNYTPWEGRIEKYLTKNIKAEIIAHMSGQHGQVKKQQRPKVDIAKIKKKLERLKDLYMEELIDLESYRADYHKLNQQLEEALQDQQPVNVIPFNAALKRILDIDFEIEYPKLSSEQKHRLWSSIIDKIVAVDKDTFQVIFL